MSDSVQDCLNRIKSMADTESASTGLSRKQFEMIGEVVGELIAGEFVALTQSLGQRIAALEARIGGQQ